MFKNMGVPEGLTFDELLNWKPPEEDETEATKALLKFSINNPALDMLESMINSFNSLKVLGVADYEIRHSHVLAWLIDPTAHHGLGDTVFKKILLEVMRGDKNIGDIIISDYADLDVRREWRNIDVIAVSRRNKLVFVIENKLHAVEADKQLTKYVEIVKNRYPDYTQVFAFLTLGGADPKGSDLYTPFTHKQIYDIVKSVIDIRRDYMNTKVVDFIEQYLNIVEEKIMPSDKFINLCAKLYGEHKDAIKYITDYGKPRLPIESMQDFHRRTETESVHMDKGVVNQCYSFIPIIWSGIVPETNKYTQDRYLVHFYLNFTEYEKYKITLSLVVGYFPDPAEREAFIKLLDEAVTESNSKLRFRKTSKTNTKLFTKVISLKRGSDEYYDLEDYEAVTAQLIEIYNSPEVQDVFQFIDGVIQKFDFQDTNI
jgi:hypothetical protein